MCSPFTSDFLPSTNMTIELAQKIVAKAFQPHVSFMGFIPLKGSERVRVALRGVTLDAPRTAYITPVGENYRITYAMMNWMVRKEELN